MSFENLLAGMVKSVEGAMGAIFLDSECEYVQYYGTIDSFRHKLLGAYQGILLGLIRKSVEKLRLSGLDKIVTEYENANFVTKSLKSGYFLVLVMEPDANLGKGINEMERVAVHFNDEIV